MSRFNYEGWDGEGPNPELYNRAALNALRGKRGQAVLHDLKAALLTLPQPRLIDGAFAKEGEVCALGALAGYWMAHGVRIAWGEHLIASLPQLEERLGDDLEDDEVTLELGEAMGLKRALAWAISYENDEGVFFTETPEERYRRMLGWVEKNLLAAVPA